MAGPGDAVALMHSLPSDYGGLCTFCGAQVALSYSEHSQTNPTSAETAQPSRQPVSANSLGEARPLAEPSSSSAIQACFNLLLQHLVNKTSLPMSLLWCTQL